MCDYVNFLLWVTQVVPEVVARVHALLPASWDWSGTDGKLGSSEEARERVELQRSYYGFLNALAQNQLLQALQVRPSKAIKALCVHLQPYFSFKTSLYRVSDRSCVRSGEWRYIRCSIRGVATRSGKSY